MNVFLKWTVIEILRGRGTRRVDGPVWFLFWWCLHAGGWLIAWGCMGSAPLHAEDSRAPAANVIGEDWWVAGLDSQILILPHLQMRGGEVERQVILHYYVAKGKFRKVSRLSEVIKKTVAEDRAEGAPSTKDLLHALLWDKTNDQYYIVYLSQFFLIEIMNADYASHDPRVYQPALEASPLNGMYSSPRLWRLIRDSIPEKER